MNLHDLLLARKLAGTGGGGGTGGGEEWIGDGNTHIWISLAEGRTSPRLGVGVKGTVTVDWGDGSEPDTLTGTKVNTLMYTPVHEYGKAGDYIITLSTDGEIEIGGTTTSSALLTADASLSTFVGFAYSNAIKKIELSNRMTTIGQRAFYNFMSLEKVFVPNGVTSIGTHAFYQCHRLKDLILPNSVTSIGANALYNCYSIESFIIPSGVSQIQSHTVYNCRTITNIGIPDGVTSIGSYGFSGNFSLTYVKFPSSVMTIGNYAFQDCYVAAVFDFSQHTSVPTLQGTSVFGNVASDCVFRIPASLYDEWIAGTNWSAVAAKYTFVGV